MKYLLLALSLFFYTATIGQVTLSDLPKPVARILKNTFKQQDISLKEIRSGVQNMNGDRFYAIYAEDTNAPAGYLHYGPVNTCRAGGCSGPGNSASPDYNSEYFDYLIIFNAEMAVETIQIFNYQASYGHEIAARGWLKQFSGFKGETSLEPGKNIDVISGATVSVHAITDDVQWKTRMLQQMIQ